MRMNWSLPWILFQRTKGRQQMLRIVTRSYKPSKIYGSVKLGFSAPDTILFKRECNEFVQELL